MRPLFKKLANLTFSYENEATDQARSQGGEGVRTGGDPA